MNSIIAEWLKSRIQSHCARCVAGSTSAYDNHSKSGYLCTRDLNICETPASQGLNFLVTGISLSANADRIAQLYEIKNV